MQLWILHEYNAKFMLSLQISMFYMYQWHSLYHMHIRIYFNQQSMHLNELLRWILQGLYQPILSYLPVTM